MLNRYPLNRYVGRGACFKLHSVFYSSCSLSYTNSSSKCPFTSHSASVEDILGCSVSILVNFTLKEPQTHPKKTTTTKKYPKQNKKTHPSAFYCRKNVCSLHEVLIIFTVDGCYQKRAQIQQNKTLSLLTDFKTNRID